jgi:aromatic amino acid aminotransferase I
MNPIFWEKLLCATQVETQAPSGWSQAITYGLLQKWGTDGYVEWLATLRDQYQTRRNWMCDAIAKSFDVRPVEKTELKGAEGLAVYLKGSESKPVFTFAPPMGGMFVWARFYFAESPRFKELQGNTDIVDPENAFANELWERFAENLVRWDAILQSLFKLISSRSCCLQGSPSTLGKERIMLRLSRTASLKLGILGWLSPRAL